MSKKKTELSTKEKQPVKIRYKKLANGNLSIYLDIYQNGKRNYKFLKLYLVPETNEKAKAINRKNMDLAEAIKAQMIIQLNTTIHGLSNQKKVPKYYYVTISEALQKPKENPPNRISTPLYII